MSASSKAVSGLLRKPPPGIDHIDLGSIQRELKAIADLFKLSAPAANKGNHAPQAKDVAVTVEADDTSTLIRAVFTDKDKGDKFDFSVNASTTVGTVVNNGDGTFAYDGGRSFEHLAEGERATDTFTYTVSDGRGGQDTKTVKVTVIGQNDAPIAFGVGTSKEAATPGPLLMQAVYMDVDRGDSHTFTVDATGMVGKVVNNGDGAFTYEQSGDYAYLGEGEHFYDSFSYTVTDKLGASSTAPMAAVIRGKNDAPAFLERSQTAVLNEAPGGTGSTALLAAAGKLTAHDPDQGDRPSVTLWSLSREAKTADGSDLSLTSAQVAGLHTSFALQADGGWTFAAQERNFDFLGDGETIILTAEAVVEDGHGAADHARIDIVINGAAGPALGEPLGQEGLWFA